MNNNSYRINLILSVLFFAGVATSAYMLFRIPFALRIESGGSGFLTTLYIILAITFLIGGLTLVRALQYKEELIVYRERTQEMRQAEDEAQEKKNEISLESVKSALSSSNNPNDTIQNGLTAICKQLGAGQGALYLKKELDGKNIVELTAGFALIVGENNRTTFDFGEGLIGQSAESGQVLYLDEIPEGYIKILSGLGSASPRFVLINPLKTDNAVLGVIEIAAFSAINKEHKKFVEQGAQLIAQQLSNQKG